MLLLSSFSKYLEVQRIGLATKYKENENVRQIVGMIKGLPLLPLKYVKKDMYYCITYIC